MLVSAAGFFRSATVSLVGVTLATARIHRLLGTFTPSERAVAVRYGLDEAEELGRASFTGLVAMPFQRASSEPAEANVSAEVTVGR